MKWQTTFRIVVAVLLTLAVLAIFVSPQVDSPETVLRAKQLAQLIFLALVGLATIFSGLIQPVLSAATLLYAADSAPPPSSFCPELSLPLLC